jgi:L-seryl-tRNA(Ser) seleniumtransferase
MNEPNSEKTDTFGNKIDLRIHYARGQILIDSHQEALRAKHARELLRERMQEQGTDSIYDFTGSPCEFPIQKDDLGLLISEVPGGAFFESELISSALQHLGGRDDDTAAVFNRTSAGITATILALSETGKTIVSITSGASSHPSIKRAAALAGNDFIEVHSTSDLAVAIGDTNCNLVVITGVTSELTLMENQEFIQAITIAKKLGCIVFVDDAYGARVRTILINQRPAIKEGADIAITSVQKAGLRGPRAGLLVGRSQLVEAIASRASEIGLEARTPLVVAVLRTLQQFEPEKLNSEVRAGESLYKHLSKLLGGENVDRTLLGPTISEDSLLKITISRASIARLKSGIVPAEASAGLGMLMLCNHGIVTVNSVGMPGGRVSLRLKTSEEELLRFGGAQMVETAVDDSINKLCRYINNSMAMRELIMGPIVVKE